MIGKVIFSVKGICLQMIILPPNILNTLRGNMLSKFCQKVTSFEHMDIFSEVLAIMGME